MTKLYLITGPTLPILLFKAESREGALASFRKGMLPSDAATYTNDPGFRAEELTLAALTDLLPYESKIVDDASF